MAKNRFAVEAVWLLLFFMMVLWLFCILIDHRSSDNFSTKTTAGVGEAGGGVSGDGGGEWSGEK